MDPSWVPTFDYVYKTIAKLTTKTKAVFWIYVNRVFLKPEALPQAYLYNYIYIYILFIYIYIYIYMYVYGNVSESLWPETVPGTDRGNGCTDAVRTQSEQSEPDSNSIAHNTCINLQITHAKICT